MINAVRRYSWTRICRIILVTKGAPHATAGLSPTVQRILKSFEDGQPLSQLSAISPRLLLLARSEVVWDPREHQKNHFSPGHDSEGESGSTSTCPFITERRSRRSVRGTSFPLSASRSSRARTERDVQMWGCDRLQRCSDALCSSIYQTLKLTCAIRVDVSGLPVHVRVLDDRPLTRGELVKASPSLRLRTLESRVSEEDGGLTQEVRISWAQEWMQCTST